MSTKGECAAILAEQDTTSYCLHTRGRHLLCLHYHRADSSMLRQKESSVGSV